MNIAGFILMCLFAAFSFWLAHVSRKPKTHGFEGCPRALATVSHTESREDRDGDYRGYAYVVEFLDVEGREAVGKSETFSCKRTLESGQGVEVYFKEIEDTPTRRMMKQFVHGTMNAMTTAMFGKEYTPDPRPEYRIHFCDESIYGREEKAGQRTSVGFIIFGCVMVVLGFVILFTK